MNRRLFKVFVVALVAVTLLYYSVAWALLRCSHDNDRSVFFKSFVPTDFSSQELSCLEFAYHTESIAQPSSLFRLLSVIDSFRVNSVDSSVLQWVVQNDPSDLWLRAVFEEVALSSFLIGRPSYLSLSILRI
jgi:hypothetical protein